MAEQPAVEYRCPRCQHTLTHVEDVQPEIYGRHETLTVPLASQIYACPDHGYWRLYVSGRIEKLDRR
jgi:hypothetical protein